MKVVTLNKHPVDGSHRGVHEEGHDGLANPVLKVNPNQIKPSKYRENAIQQSFISRIRIKSFN